MRGDKAASLALAALLIGSIYAIVTPVQSVNADSVEVASIPGHYIIRMDLTPDESQIYVVTRTVSNTVIGSLFRITTSTGVVEELLSSMTTPRNVFFNQVDGNVYFCYGSNQEFHRFNPSTNAVTFFADAENCDSGYVDSDGSIVFATHTGAPPFVNGGGVERLSLAGTISTVVSPFAFVVRDVAEDSNGNLYLTSEDTAANREIRRVAPDATQTVMMTGSSIGDQIEIIDDRLFTNSPGAVTEWDLDGNFVGTIYQGAPDAIKAKSLWVGDDALHKIFKINLPTCTPPPSGLVSWWPGDGNAMDIQGENHGTLQNGATFAAGMVDQAFSLDGIDDAVKVPASSSLDVGTGSGLTIDAWINPSDISTQRALVEWHNGAAFGTHFWISVAGTGSGSLYANILDSAEGNHLIYSAPSVLTANTFQHVALTYDKTSGLATLYRDGVVVAQSNLGSFTPQTSYDLYLGLRPGGPPISFAGLLDEVEIFDIALSQSEIQSIYDAGSAGKCKEPPTCTTPPTGMVGWWAGDGDANDIINANHGSLQGSMGFATGKVDQAFNFDGIDDAVKVPASSSLDVGTGSGLTIDAWINPSDISTQRALVEWNTGSGFGTHFWISVAGTGSGSLYANLHDTAGGHHLIYSAPSVVREDTFQHVALTYDKTTGVARLYRSGVVVAENNLGIFTPQTAYDLYFGERPNNPTPTNFIGTMDEVEIFDRALSQSEIQAIYNAGSAGKCKQPPTCTPPPSGMVSWWAGDGDASDLIGSNHGTLTNGATFTAGKVGQAFSFDGADDFVDIPDSANLNPTGTFTIDGWFYIDPDAAGNAGELSTLASKSDGGSDSGGWFLLYDDGQLGATGFSNALRFTVFGGDAIIAEAAAQNIITASGWYFVVGVFDAAGTPQAKLYVNGNLVASSTSTIPSILSNSLSMRIGAMHNNERFGLIFGNDRLNGLADEVEFFNRALSQSEIQAIYDAGSAGKCKDLEEPPTADPNGPYEGTEGSAVILDGSGSTDTDGTIISYDWDLDSDAAFDDATGATPAVTFADNGLYNIGLMVTDDDGLTGTATTQVTITNANPVVGAITAPIDPVQVNTAVSSSAPFTDAGTLDTHTAEWSWGDGTTSAGTVTESDGSGTIAGSHSYTTPGVYTVQLTVTDDDGGIGMQTYNYVVIYDPTAGFVTGGGWIDSPAGAYTADTSLTGKAIFGFTSKYEKGATTPTGKTNFKFHVASLDFNSNNYDWLVVAGAKAQYKGTGTINGAGDYGFMLTAIDGQITGGGGTDKFRIKIWDKATDLVVYDNQLGALDDASPTTAIGGGNIKIHKS